MTIAIIEPMNQAQTAVAGPPRLIGTPYVAGCEPSTPRIEIAYDTVDHLVNSRRSSFWLLVSSVHQDQHGKLSSTYLFITDASEQSLVVVLYGSHCCPNRRCRTGALGSVAVRRRGSLLRLLASRLIVERAFYIHIACH